MNKLAFWSVWIFVFLVPWEDVVVLPGLGTLAKVVGFGAAGVGLTAAIASGRVRVHRFLGWALAFVLWSWASVFWSLEPEATISRAFTYTQLLIVAWLICQLYVQGQRLKALMWAYVLGAWFSVLGTFWSYVQGTEVAFRRYAAEGFDPNDLSFYLNTAIVMASYLGVRSSNFLTGLISWSFIPFASATVLLTASRSGALGMAMALVFVLLALNKQERRWRALRLALLGLGGYLLATLVPQYSFMRLFSISEELSSGTLNHRTVIWHAGLEVFADYPLLGTGAGTFRFAVRPYLGLDAAPHNVFLAVAVEGGVIGLLLWLAMLVVSFTTPLLRRDADRVFWICMFAVLLFAFLSLNFEWRKVTWLIMSLAATNSAKRRLDAQVRPSGGSTS